jgi:hypothetical protein
MLSIKTAKHFSHVLSCPPQIFDESFIGKRHSSRFNFESRYPIAPLATKTKRRSVSFAGIGNFYVNFYVEALRPPVISCDLRTTLVFGQITSLSSKRSIASYLLWLSTTSSALHNHLLRLHLLALSTALLLDL